MRRRRRSSPRKIRLHEPVDLSDDLWLKNTGQVADVRTEILENNNYKCEMSGEDIKRPSLDHCHETGCVRGVISQHGNTFEGYVLKYFKKYVEKHTELSLPEWLRSLATYYETDFRRGLHFRTIHDVQVKLSNMTREDIVTQLRIDFELKADAKSDKPTLIRTYLAALAKKLEADYQYRFFR